ncbi:MAG: hypothetical protein ACWA44_15745 [Thiotrichales bacterium]
MWRKIRISILATLLLFVSGKTYLDQLDATDWKEPLDVVVYPISSGDSAATEQYVNSLTAADFASITDFIRAQADHYEVNINDPMRVRIAPPSDVQPPARESHSILETVLFSLKFRFWAAWHDLPRKPGDIRLFVVFHDPELNDQVPDSLALPKGLLGLIHAFAGEQYAGTNSFVMTHELLHTLGATDKYDPADNSPLFPVGYANPFSHRYPQSKAEIMGGRIPLDEELAFIPDSLSQAVIGSQTAVEINWFR